MGRFEHSTHGVEASEDGVHVVDLVSVFAQIVANRSGDLQALEGHEPAPPSDGGRVEFHVFRERFGFRFTERNEFAETGEVHFVGDRVEGVSMLG